MICMNGTSMSTDLQLPFGGCTGAVHLTMLLFYASFGNESDSASSSELLSGCAPDSASLLYFCHAVRLLCFSSLILPGCAPSVLLEFLGSSWFRGTGFLLGGFSLDGCEGVLLVVRVLCCFLMVGRPGWIPGGVVREGGLCWGHW